VYATNSTVFVAGNDMKVQKELTIRSGLGGLDVDSRKKNIYWTNSKSKMLQNYVSVLLTISFLIKN